MGLQAAYDRFRERGAEILAIAVQDISGAQWMKTITGAGFPILADAEHRVAEAYGVFNLFGDGLAAPSVFVISRDGSLVWHYIGRDPNDRPSPDEIIAHIP